MANDQLRLENVRGVLIRLEETIIFSLIERAQFAHNAKIYEAGALGEALGARSLVDQLLFDCECSHARVRRYTSPDEHPFSAGLPEPILPALSYSESPVAANDINVNASIRRVYEDEIIPVLCSEVDDGQYGSSAVCDVACLQSLSKRIHYGKFVAESKLTMDPDHYRPAIAAGDAKALMTLISDAAVEAAVLRRVGLKAQTYGEDPEHPGASLRLDPQAVVDLYERWVIPVNKDVQVRYLLGRR